MDSDILENCIYPSDSIREAMACIERSTAKVALVVDGQHKLLDTITDGDVRRSILAGDDLDAPVGLLRDRKINSPYTQAVTALVGTETPVLLRLMRDRNVRQIPLLDSENRVVGLVTLEDLAPREVLQLRAVIMAGGFGERLMPLTKDLPKPMLPVGGRPLLELIIEQLQKAGLRRVNLTTHHKAKAIEDHFGDGENFGVEIRYVKENSPLGTAGSLRTLASSNEPLLVINGDILTRVDFRAMHDFHTAHQADMTVAVTQHDFHIPYGVVETKGADIISISEKPVVQHFINAGIYLLQPSVCQYIPSARPYDMPDLITQMIQEGHRVVSFPVHEYWLDIGQADDYSKAIIGAQQEQI